MTFSLLQSKTPALVFEYINNTDFKVSLPECGGERLFVKCCDFQIIFKSCGGNLEFSQLSASLFFLHVNQKSVNGLWMKRHERFVY